MAGVEQSTTTTVLLPPDADFDEHSGIVTIPEENVDTTQTVAEEMLNNLEQQTEALGETRVIYAPSTENVADASASGAVMTAVTITDSQGGVSDSVTDGQMVVIGEEGSTVTTIGSIPVTMTQVIQAVSAPLAGQLATSTSAGTIVNALPMAKSEDAQQNNLPVQQTIFTDESGQPLDPETQQLLLSQSENGGQQIIVSDQSGGDQQLMLAQTSDGEWQPVVFAQGVDPEPEVPAVPQAEDQDVYIRTPQGQLQRIIVTNQPELDKVTSQPSQAAIVENSVVQAVSNVENHQNQDAESTGTVSLPETMVQASNVDKSQPALPLGHSENPIRIVQQGNQYTSLQQLTPEQLSQIMQVVQQQQIARKATTEEGSGSVLFNPVTQTRIVYRVIYPSELHKQNSKDSKKTRIQVQVPTSSVAIQQPKRTYRKRRTQEGDERMAAPELSKREKEERKKHRPRTRSGRVSKPPKHMVQDYKQIHLVDWDEDYDDSDGGYSDFKQSDEEGERNRDPEKKDAPYAPYLMLASSKAKNFKCETCDKAYIGRAGLARHYRLKPDHGTIEGELDSDSMLLADESSNASTIDSVPVTAINSTPPSASSSTTIVSSPSGSIAAETPVTASATTANGLPTTVTASASTSSSITSPATPSKSATPAAQAAGPQKQTPRAALRAQQMYIQENNSSRRKARLKEFLRQCQDEELMEVMLPRLAKVVTLWEFLLMKTEQGKPPKPSCSAIYREFETLHRQVKRICKRYLSLTEETPASVGASLLGQEPEDEHKVQITDEALAKSLGLEVGVYASEDISVYEDPTLQYKFLTSDAGAAQSMPNTGSKRKVEVVTPEQLKVGPSSKRPRLAIGSPPSKAAMSLVSTVSSSKQPTSTKTVLSDTKAILSKSEHSRDGKSAGVFTVMETPDDEPAVPARSTVTMTNALSSNTSQVVTLVGQEPSRSSEKHATVTVTGTPIQKSQLNGSSHTIVIGNGIKTSTGETVKTSSGETTVQKQQQQQQQQGQSSGNKITLSLTNPSGNKNIAPMILIDEKGQIINPEMLQISHSANGEQLIKVEQKPEVKSEEIEIEGKSGASENNTSVTQVMEVHPGGSAAQGNFLEGQLTSETKPSELELASSMANTVNSSEDQMHLAEGQPQLVTLDGSSQQQVLTNGMTQYVVENGNGAELVGGDQEMQQAQIFQTEDGLILIQNPDGSFQVHGQSDQPISLETVQALLAVDGDGGQMQVVTEGGDATMSGV